MARPVSDRMRLKDKIIDNISKAIKSIQEQLYYQSNDPVLNSNGGAELKLILTNSDRPCHKLCENLDHAFLHGLKQVTHGYWPVVKLLSHKNLVRDIEILGNVMTDLGRGRAWLFAILNESLLESYIRLLGENEKLIKKYYSKDALMLDGDRMHQLLTLTFGLELVTFKFELDLPYLDLNAYPPRSRTDTQMEGDFSYQVNGGSGYARSMSTSELYFGSVESRARLASDSDSASMASIEANTQLDQGLQLRLSVYSTDSGFPNDNFNSVTMAQRQRSVTPPDINLMGKSRSLTPSDTLSVASLGSAGEQDRHQRLESINPAAEDEEGGQVLEVIHMTKISKKKKKKNTLGVKEKRTKSTTLETPAEAKSGAVLVTGESDLSRNLMEPTAKETSQLSNLMAQDDNIIKESDISNICDQTRPDSDSACGQTTLPQHDSGVDICHLASSHNDVATTPNSLSSQQEPPSATHFKNGLNEKNSKVQPSLAMSSLATIESKIASLCSPSQENDQSSHVAIPRSHNSNSSPLHLRSSYSEDPTTQNKSSSHSSLDNWLNKDVGLRDSAGLSEKSSNSSKRTSGNDDDADVYSDYLLDNDGEASHQQGQVEGLSRAKAAIQSASQLKDYMDYILQSNHHDSSSNTPAVKVTSAELDLSVNLDNNTKLQVMLDILTQEDEKFIKMFASRENMMEGDSGVIYLLISDHCLYFLKYKEMSRKFIKQSSARLVDLIFISTGLNDQMFSIESQGKSKQKQRMWVTPGHQALTRCILECLTDAVKKTNEYNSSLHLRFSVESEVPVQKIALGKYISKELNCEPSDVTIMDYSLVFWEDPSSSFGQSVCSNHKEGTLLMWTQDPIKGYMWKPVYVVLKNSLLSVSNHKSDPRPHSLLGLGGDQCVGCRLTSVGDRNYCVELVIARGDSWLLSAANEVEIAEWRHALCLAVSMGTEEENSLVSCVPCCAVLACGNIFLCHEDLQTKFFRTLGRAKVEDITSLRVDSMDATYCILVFESQEVKVTSVNWVFYFSSAQDLNRCRSAIGQVWKENFQVDIPVLPLDDAGLEKNCHSHSQLLHQQLSFC